MWFFCKTETLAGGREYRCCEELGPARRIMLFDGSIERIRCITEHEDCTALTNKTVLSLVGPGVGKMQKWKILAAFR